MSVIEHANRDPILDPSYVAAEARRHFESHLAKARSIADYGSNLLKRLIATRSSESVEDLIIIGGPLRASLSCFDAALLCLENGAVAASHLHVRSLLELDLYVDWLLTRPKLRWARQLYVASVRREREWACRGISGTAEHQSFSIAWRSEFGDDWSIPVEDLDYARQRVSAIDALLDSDTYREINGWFDRARSKRHFDPEWYKVGPDAPRSIFALAKKLNRAAYYLSVYQMCSDHVHGTRSGHGFGVAKDLGGGHGLVRFEPIRKLSEFSFPFTTSVHLMLRIFERALEHYRPSELRNFSSLLAGEWAGVLELPEVRENPTAVDL
jgi:hypothetical protein